MAGVSDRSGEVEPRGASRTGRNWYKVIVGVQLILLTVVLAPVVLVASCIALTEEGDESELYRVTSPDGNTDAVLVQDVGCCGATSSVDQEFYLVPSGTEGLSNKAFTIDGLDGYGNLDLRWRGEGLLEARYPAAYVANFRNHATLENEQGERYVVEIRLVPPEDEISLPPFLAEDMPGERTLPE